MKERTALWLLVFGFTLTLAAEIITGSMIWPLTGYGIWVLILTGLTMFRRMGK